MGRASHFVEDQFSEAESRQSYLVSEDRRMYQLLQRRVCDGEVVRIAPRIYARKSYYTELDPNARAIHMLRALSRRSPDMVFSHTSAALAYGLQVPWRLASPIHCVVPRESHSRSTSGIIRHAHRSIDAIMFDGIRVTTPECTVADCLRTLDLPEGLAIADSVIATGLLTKTDMCDAIEARVFYPGAEHAIQTARLADGRAENGGESYARATMLELGCASPDLQHEIVDPLTGAKYYSDFFWEREDGFDIAGELDGYEKYFNATMTSGKTLDEVLLDERVRESRISASNIKVMRFRFADVLDRVGFAKLLGAYDVPMDNDPPRLQPHPRLCPKRRLHWSESE